MKHYKGEDTRHKTHPKHQDLYRTFVVEIMWSLVLQSRCSSRVLHSSVSLGLEGRRISNPSLHRNLSRRFYVRHPPAGLFSIEGLNAPSDFLRLAKEAIDKSDSLREGIPSEITSHAHAVQTLYQLDEISKTVCNVIDAAELCRNAHASEDWRQLANETFGKLQQYIATLNADQRLYRALAAVEREYGSDLTEEESRFCFLLKREFELDGIHLPDAEREQVQLLHQHVVDLETLWMGNITNSQKQYWLNAAAIESVLPRHVLEANGAVYDEIGNEKRVGIVADSPIANSISSFSTNGDLRRQVHWESMTNTPENKEVLNALIHQRHELAAALGFESYAVRNLQDKMAQTPQGVMDFLRDLEQQIRPQYKKDLEILGRAKAQIEGSSIVEAWDVKFYTKLLKAQLGVDPNELAPYLGLDNCLNALQVLVDRLFHIEMKEEALHEGETWDIDDNNMAPPGRIRKFCFSDGQTQQPLGTMYLDLHPRPGKYTHAAHFTIRCGCRISGPESAYQLPIVALVCNMNSGAATLSSHGEVETLFHEMGHALHSLLSRTNFQHMAGTRAAIDFVETPSNFLEHFVWDAEFLPILCQADGRALPDETIKALVGGRNQFRCLEMQNQIALSRFDQEIFGGPAVPGRPQQIWEQLHSEYNIPFVTGSHFYTNVGHFVTYGAGYYGYLYSQVFADAIWNQVFTPRSLDRTAGQKLWHGLLIHGGARDAQQMLNEILGGKQPTVQNYWSSIKAK
jgi:mitochondrial intermediate peptidase